MSPPAPRAALRRVTLAVVAFVVAVFHAAEVRELVMAPNVGSRPGFTVRANAPGALAEGVREKWPDGSDNPIWAAGLRDGDRLIAIVDARGTRHVIRSGFDVSDGLRAVGWGEPWSIEIARDGTARTLHVAPAPPWHFRWSQVSLIFALVIVMPALAWLAGTFVGFARPGDVHAFRAAMMLLGFSTFANGGTDPGAPWRWFALVAMMVLPFVAGYYFMRFFLSFPRDARLLQRFPWIPRVTAALSVTVVAVSGFFGGQGMLSFELATRVRSPFPAWFLAAIDAAPNVLIVAAIAVGVQGMVQNARADVGLADRRRLRLMRIGALLTFVPLLAAILLIALGVRSTVVIACVALTIWIFPAMFAYAVVRHEVFGIKVFIRRGLQYALVARGAFVLGLVLFSTVYFTAGRWLLRHVPNGGEVLASIGSAGLALALAAGLRNVNRRLMPAIDRMFFREAYDARRILSGLADAVRERAAEPDALLDLVTAELHEALHPATVRIVLHGGGDAAVTAACEALAARVRPDAPRTIDVLRGDDPVPRLRDPRSDVLSLGADAPARELLTEVHARLVVPLSTGRRVAGFLVLGEKLSEEPYSREDRELLLAVAGHTAMALDYAELIRQTAERERDRREMELAQQVQAQLFPQDRPPLRTLRYVGVSHPARVLGGDYYDFLPLGEGRLGLAVADLAGKGVSAALLMATVQGTLRSLARERADDPAGIVAALNDQLCASAVAGKYATLFYATYDDRTRTLRAVNAGHDPPLLLRPSRAGGPPELRRLATGGMVVGLFPGQAYEVEEVVLEPGDVLVVVTDGVTDAVDPADEPFGAARLADVVRAHVADEPPRIEEAVFAALAAHARGVPYGDDVTLVVAKVV